METIKKLFTELEKAERESDALDDKWNESPDDENLEKAWDKAYQKVWKISEDLANEISVFTGGKVNEETAFQMLRSKRAELKAIIGMI